MPIIKWGYEKIISGRRVYDLDDTLILPTLTKKQPWKKYFWKVNDKVDKEGVEVILTSRNMKDAEITWATVKKAGFKNVHTIIFNPKQYWGRMYLATWKARVLHELKAKEYIDNDVDFNVILECVAKITKIWRRRKCLTVDELRRR